MDCCKKFVTILAYPAARQESRGKAEMHPLLRQHTATDGGGISRCLLVGKGSSNKIASLACTIAQENFTVACRREQGG